MGLCYPKCRSDYLGVGPVCWEASCNGGGYSPLGSAFALPEVPVCGRAACRATDPSPLP